MSTVIDIIVRVMNLLPEDPFQDFLNIELIEPYLPYINYFVPFGTCAAILLVWCTAMSSYTVYKWIRKLLKGKTVI